MNIAFWNTHKNKTINEFIKKMIQEKNIDIMIVSEYADDINKLINELYVCEEYYNEILPIACKKIKIICKNDINVQLNNDCSNYISITINKNDFNFELFAVHFPSKLHTSNANRELIAGMLKNDIEKYDRSIIVGDFNSNPFDKSMSALSGLLALPTKDYTKRKVQNIEKNILYNPMWKFFGDFEDIPGTYFYNSSDDINYFWYIFDQVLISHDLIKLFKSNKLEIIKEINRKKLIKKNKIDGSISDHLPIFFSIEEENYGKSMEK